MKKTLLLLGFLFSITLVMAQLIDRTMVILEKGTGTWCSWCPSAAQGVEDLLENGKPIAVVANHNNDSYANTYSNARNSMYQIGNYPTAVFDGRHQSTGGSTTGSTAGMYTPYINQRMSVASAIQIGMDVTNTGLDYTATFTITKLANIAATDMRLIFFVTESHIPVSWFNQTEVNFVNRLMVPGQNGTPLDFSSGNVQTVVLNFSLQSNWVIENCEFVAAVQNYDAGQPGGSAWIKECLNGIKRGVIDLTGDFTASATQINKDDQVTFTSEYSGGYVGPVPVTYTWQFPGAYPINSFEPNPTVTYTKCGIHQVTLFLNKGGQILTITKESYITVGTPLNVTITTSPGDTTCWYQPITLDATTPGAVSYLWEPGGITTPDMTVDGGAVGAGAHEYTVTVTGSDGCEFSQAHEIYFDQCVGLHEMAQNLALSVYPNPNTGSFLIEITTPSATPADLKIYNTLNELVYEEEGIMLINNQLKSLDLNLANGLYVILLQQGQQKTVRKFFITY